ncbi:transposase [Waterburya agarophytonicola K14]|uniref:Transposase n=1 Tax=Waterburya agarophytonicola KI4 TaxID=2874699 RepID=A0A964BUE8_9CYAN|nr:transposase [Waterburya agarophytonicola]MCC0178396.1 transposase [Waterburya agarophytonicola KI4]
MKSILTIVCKLNPSKEVVKKIDTTLEMFAAACNYANKEVKPAITSKTTIQSLVYQTIRSEYNLSANLAVRACARVGANRKTAKKDKKPVKEFKPASADYDARIFAFREGDWSVSLTLVGGREHIPIVTSNYQIGKLKGSKPTSAQLCKHKDGNYYIHIQVKDEAPKPIDSDNVIGVDFGRTDIAVTSDHNKWSGKEIRDVRDKHSKQRANLQKKASKGTRSSRRRCRTLLKRLSGKEKRFQRHVNHVISKTIVLSAKQSNSIIAIEDLTGIRKRTNQQPRSKTERRRSNSWAFFQLRTFLEYKGLINGIEVLPVSPRYTSQTCHACMHLGLRSGKRFKCTNSICGWHGDADENASYNLSIIGGVVTLHRGSDSLSCALDSGLLKRQDLAMGQKPVRFSQR